MEASDLCIIHQIINVSPQTPITPPAPPSKAHTTTTITSTAPLTFTHHP